MTKIEQLLKYCDDSMQQTECEKCEYEGGCFRRLRTDCYECLSKIHNVHNHDLLYACDKILYNYVLKHQIRYVSEMIYALDALNCKNQFNNEIDSDEVSFFSIGCGPASELYAIDYYWDYKKIRNRYVFKGFEKIEKWKVINNYSELLFNNPEYIKFVYMDFFEFFLEQEKIQEKIDVLIANYLFSDIMRYDQGRAEIMVDFICNLLVNKQISAIIVNDISLFYTTNFQGKAASAYQCLEWFENKLNGQKEIKLIKKRFQDGYQLYGDKFKHNSCFFNENNCPQYIKKYEPFLSCNSIIFIAMHI